VTAEAATPLSLEQFEAELQACLCLVDVDVPLVALTDGVHSRSFAGNGLVVFQVGGRGTWLHLVGVGTVRATSSDATVGVQSSAARSASLRHADALHACTPPPQGENVGLVLVDRNTVAIG
jgi:hypothetical protein